jgi:predicted permease
MNIWSRFLRRDDQDSDLAGEIESYIEHEIQEQVARGVEPDQARFAARKKFGNATLVREELYRMNSIGILDRLWQDTRYALRVLRKSPGFTTVAVLSLAMGIGVNTTMFSVLHAVLLRPLPYPESDRLVQVGHDGGRQAAAIPEFEFWREHNRAFSSIAGYRGGGERRLSQGNSHDWISTLTVTTDFVRTLGVAPALGREFLADETLPTGPRAIILSNGLWRRSFGADPMVIGRTVTLDEDTYTIVGVLPAQFWFVQAADALVPLRPTGSLSDTGTNTQLIARLQGGITIEEARAQMPAIAAAFRQAYAGNSLVSREYRGLSMMPLRDRLVGDLRTNLLLLFGASGLLLMIACSNLATLLMTRFAMRGKELAVRLSLGGSIGRLMAQFFVENLLLAALGAAAGLLTGYWLLQGLLAWMPFDLPVSAPVKLDGVVLAFTTGVAAITALFFTLVPLLSTQRLNVHEMLKSAGRTAGSIRPGTRSALIVGEVALSTTLLIAAGLLIQSLYRLHQQQLGFSPQDLFTFETPLSPARQRNPADRMQFTNSMLERLKAVPGVESVAATNVLPLVGWGNLPTQREGHPEQSIGGMEVRAVTPGFFELMGAPVRRGRSFTEADSRSALPVAMVNETLQQRWWPEGNAIGDRLVIGRFRGKAFLNDPPREVIGVAGDMKTKLADLPWPTVFVPMPQAEKIGNSQLSWIVRARSHSGLDQELRRAVADVDPGQRIRRLRAMNEIVASTTSDARFNASLFGLFAVVALASAVVGVYGLVSFLVAQRRQEIGTRIALGAGKADVMKLFLTQGVALSAAGVMVGVACGYAVSRWMASLLSGVQPRDSATFVVASLVLLAAALAATYVPARRATKIDPMTALRCE